MEEELSHADKARTGKPRAAAARNHYPAKIKLIRPYGWLDDDGTNHHFIQDFETEVPEQIKLLVDRNCPDYVVIE